MFWSEGNLATFLSRSSILSLSAFNKIGICHGESQSTFEDSQKIAMPFSPQGAAFIDHPRAGLGPSLKTWWELPLQLLVAQKHVRLSLYFTGNSEPSTELLTTPIPCKTVQWMKHLQSPWKRRGREQLHQSCLGACSPEAASSLTQSCYRWSSKCTIAGSGKEGGGWTEQDLLSLHSWNWVQKLIAICREMSLRCEGSVVAVMGPGCVWCWRFELHPSEHRW